MYWPYVMVKNLSCNYVFISLMSSRTNFCDLHTERKIEIYMQVFFLFIEI